MTYIAEFKAPKQRMTRQFGYVIKQQADRSYSVHRKFYDRENSYEHGTYDLTYEKAAAEFAECVRRHVTSYPPETFDTQEVA